MSVSKNLGSACVHIRIETIGEQIYQTDEQLDWLGPQEHRELCGWRAPQRREQWLNGRRLAKKWIPQWLGRTDLKPTDLQILSRHLEESRGTAPRVYLNGQIIPVAFSIAHTSGCVAIAIIDEPDWSVGIDLVEIGPVAPGFTSTWFSEREQQALRASDQTAPLRYWAAKEALFKAKRHNRFIPRQWELEATSESTFHRMGDPVRPGAPADVKVWQCGNFIVALACSGPSDRPWKLAEDGPQVHEGAESTTITKNRKLP